MRIEPQTSIEEVAALLAQCALPVADISVSSPPLFFGVRDGDALAAVVGLELYPPFGLLRSLAVRPALRNRGLARELTAFAESYAAAQGVASLFLLTTTAERFFLDQGYSPVPRGEAPPVIRATPQFSALCPASSALLRKNIADRRPRTTPSEKNDATATIAHGGCACGAVRYRVEGQATNSMFCHCQTCRRVSAAPAVAWVTFDLANFAMVRGRVAEYASSPPVRRTFCPSCGTPLTYRHEERPGGIDITTCSLDEPGAFPPTHHSWLSHDILWVRFGDGLPTYPEWRE